LRKKAYEVEACVHGQRTLGRGTKSDKTLKRYIRVGKEEIRGREASRRRKRKKKSKKCKEKKKPTKTPTPPLDTGVWV
jgi:hypothetical protein